MASWHDWSICSRIDLVESEGLATCLSCGSIRDQPYVYQPIRQRSEIRLLKLQPGEGDDPVRGELVIISTSSQQRYDAVSYTWADQTGDATRRFRAFIGTRACIGTRYVFITRSSQEVLQRIRSRFYTKYVWIDSLCVDQDNLQERGHQVDLMPLIYTRAKKTYVYAGLTTSKDESILEALATGRVEHGWGADKESSLATLNKFLCRPYFFRVWVIQEIALSPNPVIICGEKEFPWSVLQTDTAQQSYDVKLENCVVSPLLSLGKRRLRYSTELPDLLRLGRHCQATDPRDRVFALLGLVVGAEAESLVADYGRDTTEVFIWIARYLAKKGTAADVLGNVNMCEDSAGSGSLLGPQNQLQLPSWVPDWTNATLTFLDRFPKARIYLESLSLQPEELDMGALTLTGFGIGTGDKLCSSHGLEQFYHDGLMLVQPLTPGQQFPPCIFFQVGGKIPEAYKILNHLLFFQEVHYLQGSDLGRHRRASRGLSNCLMVLAPVMPNMHGNSEVLGLNNFHDFGIYAEDQHTWFGTFRFLGLFGTMRIAWHLAKLNKLKEQGLVNDPNLKQWFGQFAGGERERIGPMASHQFTCFEDFAMTIKLV